MKKSIQQLVLLVVISFLHVSNVAAQRERTLQTDTKFKQIGTANVMIMCKAGTVVKLTSRNELIEGVLAENTTIARPGWSETAALFAEGTQISFHDDGAPKRGTLAVNTSFIRNGTMNKRVELLANTEVQLSNAALAQSGTLARDETFTSTTGNKKIFKKNTPVRFLISGMVE